MDIIYHYDSEFHFLLGYTNEQRQDGVPIPAHSTLIEPPQFLEGQIPVFDTENQLWKIVEDTFWRPTFEMQPSLQSEACDISTPYEIVMPMSAFMKTSTKSISCLLNGSLFTISLFEHVAMLNTACVKAYENLSSTLKDISSSYIKVANFNFPLNYIEYKNSVHNSIYIMRSICDLLVMSISLELYKNDIWKDKKFSTDCIGKILNARSDKEKNIKDHIIKNDSDLVFLERINNISNGLKHSFLNCESGQQMISDYPIINVYYAHYNNFGGQNIITYREYINILMIHMENFLHNVFQ
ncbi:hypothetical protein ACUZ9P_11955 [Desulfovibrio sp. QI0430]